MSNNVKVIHLDDEDFSVESDSDESSPDLGTVTSSTTATTTTTTTTTSPADQDATPASPDQGGAGDKDSVDESTDADSECNTADLLASDPLYFILSKFFMTADGKSLVTVLDEINKKLDKLT